MPTKSVQKSEKVPAIQQSAQQVWLAGLGALAMAEEEGSRLFQTLTVKGSTFERRNRKRLGQMITRAQADVRSSTGDAMGKIGQSFDASMTAVLHRLGMPTRTEISTLTRRVEELTRAVRERETTHGRTRRTPTRTRTRAVVTTKREATPAS